jgi:hypothetical protein
VLALLAALPAMLTVHQLSPEFRHKLSRVVAKTRLRLSALQGYEPQPLSLHGTVEAPGAQIHVLEPPLGWASQSDREGRFLLTYLTWYRGAEFDLLIRQPGITARQIRVSAPNQFPAGGVFELGKLNLEEAEEVPGGEPGGIDSHFQAYDAANAQYYEDLFRILTAGKHSHEERILAVNDHVAAKLNYEQGQKEPGSPRLTLESGSQYCGHLAAAMATLLTAGQYEVRQIDMTDGKTPSRTHVVVEVAYDSGWHLFDPTFGVVYRRKDGAVASYSDVRLNPELITPELYSHLPPKQRRDVLDLMRSTYGSGLHHYYRFTR